MSVRRALLITTLVSIVPALGIIIATGVEYGHVLEENVRREATRQVQAISEMQNQTVEIARRTLETVAALPAFRDGDYESQREILTDVLEKNPEFVNMSATDRTGAVVASPGLSTGTDLSDRVHIRNSIATGAFAAGEFILARTDGETAFPFTVPVRNRDGVVIGTVSAVYSLEAYASFFERLQLPEETILGITDRNGIRIFFRPIKETNPIGKPIDSTAWSKFSGGDDTGTIVSLGADGVRRYYAYRRLYLEGEREPYMYVVVGFPERLAVNAALAVVWRNVLLLVGILAIALMLTYVVGGAIFGRYVDRVAETAARISRGDLSARTDIPPSLSEIGTVAAAIDEMAANLQARRTEQDREKQRVARSLQEKEILLREIHHRVKNNMQLILSIVHLQRGTTTDLDVFCNDLEVRISAVAGVHEQLYQSADLSSVMMQDFFEGLAGFITTTAAAPAIAVDADDITLPIERAIPLALITSELLVNAVKYGCDESGACRISVSLARSEVRSGPRLVLSVRDNGPGFPDGFNSLAGGGLGMQLIHILSEQLAGELTIASIGQDAGRDTGDDGVIGGTPSGGGSGAVVTLTMPGNEEA